MRRHPHVSKHKKTFFMDYITEVTYSLINNGEVK